MEWKPIETAPVNEPILVAFEWADPTTGRTHYDVWPAMKNLFYRARKPKWLDLDDGPLTDHVIGEMRYWMPFPAPPKVRSALRSA